MKNKQSRCIERRIPLGENKSYRLHRINFGGPEQWWRQEAV